MSAAPAAPPAASAEAVRPRRRSLAHVPAPHRRALPRRAAEAAPRPHRALHARDPADPLARRSSARRSTGSTRSRPATCRTSTSSRPAIIAQSALFISIFYGIQIIWERDAGVLDEAARHADAAGRADHRQGVRGGLRAFGRSSSCSSSRALLGVALTDEPAEASLGGVRGRRARRRRSSRACRCRSPGIVLKRDRLMGIGQTITMPLFFASNALYPIAHHARAGCSPLSHVNPLSYEVDALRGLLIGTPAHLAARLRRARGLGGRGDPRRGEPARPPRALSAAHVIPARRQAPATERANGSRRPACARHRCAARTPQAWIVAPPVELAAVTARHPSAVRGAPWRAAAKTATAAAARSTTATTATARSSRRPRRRSGVCWRSHWPSSGTVAV